MAVLEAFVYDPLLNWRLIETGSKNKKAKAANTVSGSAMENVAGAAGESVAQMELNPLTSGEHVAPRDNKTSDQEGSATLAASGNTNGSTQQQPEALNKKALDIVQRVRDKLTGRDFDPNECFAVSKQVDLLIRQATNNENL